MSEYHDYECGDYDYEDERMDAIYDDPMDYPIDGVGFAQEGSALRAETPDNPRNLPCPSCGRENMLTPIDVYRGYQCDYCADAAEGKYGEY